ncbi:MAG: hypothetical protein KDC13_01125 [Bacteroidetes bacterium]|nr:hypothetical protein [Bacteroidota bacterium]
MNRLKNQAEKESAKPKSKPGPVSTALHTLVDGTLLESIAKPGNMAFGLFTLLLIGLYIANSYSAERTIRNTANVEKELKELHSEYISMKSDLMFLSNQSQVAERVAALDLHEAKTPPHKIIVPRQEVSRK